LWNTHKGWGKEKKKIMPENIRRGVGGKSDREGGYDLTRIAGWDIPRGKKHRNIWKKRDREGEKTDAVGGREGEKLLN